MSVEVGESSEAKYWFICPNKTLQNGLTDIVGDGDIVIMLKSYASLDNIVLYSENMYIPFIQFDTQENLDYEKCILENEFNNDDVNLDDEEHILEDENEVGAEHDSDAPSSVLGDMEGTSDEDVQSSINDTMTRRERSNYRKKKLKDKHELLRKKTKYDVENDVLGANRGIDGWFSDIEDDTCLNNPLDYHVAEPIFNPNANLRTYDLVKGMKFKD
ncbi:hypothetical protein LIER_02364 [Lithospermum erythrorhizon]|uniref:Uncharacterized protein n=1 Tax=Lithospermum erythrorhizon TaxID=34254 RepID=A0AAV3NRN4_LITER